MQEMNEDAQPLRKGSLLKLSMILTRTDQKLTKNSFGHINSLHLLGYGTGPKSLEIIIADDSIFKILNIERSKNLKVMIIM